MNKLVNATPRQKLRISLPLVIAAATIMAFLSTPYAAASSERVELSTTIRKCGATKRFNCVVDGDTLWLGRQKIRVADIDTPEISEPKCASELALGNKATGRLIALINEGPFELHAWPGRDTDRYGRKLRVLVRNGHSLGDILVSEGLARTWTGRREPWCE